MSFKIETNVPLPIGYARRSCKEYPFDKLEVGDSFVVTLGGRRSWGFIFTATQEAQAKLGIKLATKLVDDENRRIWRVA